ncbi:uncharacterized protein LOC126828411 [Patella vulgata]|uniref:uncharacterized protein LOC126828411 n=1 Tax=Patella vulgata TaxID=6465 RepID=UPI00217F6BBB|nr:uncharacterized protein LOC126828411 [Patella vulgata]
MAGAQTFVDAKLAQKKVLLFTKSYCPESETAKTVLDGYKLMLKDFEVVEIEKRQDCIQIENYLHRLSLTNSRVTPQLFVAGKYVGSDMDIPRLHSNGQLKQVLQQAKVIS